MLRVRVASAGWAGGPGLNTFYFVATVENANTATTCVDRVHAALLDLDSIWANGHTMQVSGDVDQIDSITGDITNTFSVASPALIGPNTSGLGEMPPATAAQVEWVTSTFLAGRRLRGRAFLSPLNFNMSSQAGTIPVASLAPLENFAGAIVLPLSTDPDMVIWRRPRKANATHVPPITARAGATGKVTSWRTPTKFAVLKSRRD